VLHVFLLLSNIAFAERGLDIAVSNIDISSYPSVAVDVRVGWEQDFGPAGSGTADGWKITLHEDKQPVEGLKILKGRSIDKQFEVLRVTYQSKLPAGARIATLRLEKNGIHNGDGQPVQIASKEQVQTNAYLVIAGGGKTPADAAKQLSDYKNKGYPRPDGWPRQLDSTWISGLNPAFHIVAVAAPTEKAVAEELVASLKSSGVGAYFRPVWVPYAQPLHLYVADFVLEDGDPDLDASTALGQFQFGGAARQDKRGKWVFAYETADGPGGMAQVIFEPPQDLECETAMLPAPGSAWIERHALGAPVQCWMVGD
jgi:hypothetical protein